MGKAPKRLGRGLSSLIPDYRKDDSRASAHDEVGALEESRAPNGASESVKSGSDGVARSELTTTPNNLDRRVSHSGTQEDAGGVARSEGGVVEEAVTTATGGGHEVLERPGDVARRPGALANAVGSGEVRFVETKALSANRFQPRRLVDEESIKSLAESIKSKGMIQPIVAREREGKLEIIVGERRWRAAEMAKVDTVPVIVREADDQEALELALIENIHREDLNALDRALAYRTYCDTFGFDADRVAERVGEDRSTVVNYLRLLELPKEVKLLLVGRRISMGHARSLLGLASDDRRVALANMVAEGRLSVRALEDQVRKERERRPKPRRRDRGAEARAALSAHVREMEGRFEDALRTKVRIYVGRSKGRGRVVIEFFSLDDFDRISRAMGVKKEE